MVTLGERLKRLRNDRGLSVRKAAEKLNVSRTSLSRYEREERSPAKEFINKAADFYNVSTDYLLGRTDIKNPDIEIPEGVKELLSEEENEFIIDLLNNEEIQLFLRESRGASDEDLATAVRVIKAVREGKETGTKI